jgi:hypothetical protein
MAILTAQERVRAEPTKHEKLDAAFVNYRLEEAGATLLALPCSGHTTRLRLSQLDIVHSALEAYGWERGRIRPPIPSAARISRMDQALQWISLIPDGRYVLRRILGARSLVSPVTERHLYSWRRLGQVLGADHKAVQRWHAQGIDMVVAALVALQSHEGARIGPGATTVSLGSRLT